MKGKQMGVENRDHILDWEHDVFFYNLKLTQVVSK